LKAVREQALQNLEKANAILELYNKMKSYFIEATHSQYAIHALDWIFERPIFKSSDFVRSPQIPEATAKRILSVLKQKGILQVVTEGAGQRSSVLAYSELLNIAEGYQAF
jgi:Fic family protein